MNTVTVIASPRHDGNCKRIVDKITEGINENGGVNEIYFMDELNINHCIACKKCKDLNNPTKCIIEDDFRMIMDKVEAGCALIFACPNYFGEINALGHLFMERFYSMTKTTPNRLDGTSKAVVIHTYGARMGYYDEYINKRARLFESIGLNVVAVLGVGENLPSKGDASEILQKAKDIGLKL